MRRSMVLTMFLGLVALSTPLPAQESTGGWTAGLSATVGTGWQYQGVDIGVVRRRQVGPFQHYTLVARIGSFIDEAAIFGGARGFVGAAAFGVRTGAKTLAEIGPELNQSRIAADLTFEVAGYAASNSPLPEGSLWFSAAVLPGVRFGGSGTQFAITVGPAVFVGSETKVRAFLSVRGEFPLVPR